MHRVLLSRVEAPSIFSWIWLFGMLGVLRKLRAAPLFLVLILAGSVCWAGEQLDKTRYIAVDEIRPGMEAYCLTTYSGKKRRQK